MLPPEDYAKIFKIIRMFVLLAIVVYAAKIGRMVAILILSSAD